MKPASQTIRNKIMEICPWAKGHKIEQIISPVDTIEIYAVRRKDGDNTYFLHDGKHLNTCFASVYWRLDDFRSSLNYYSDCPDSVLRAMDKVDCTEIIFSSSATTLTSSTLIPIEFNHVAKVLVFVS